MFIFQCCYITTPGKKKPWWKEKLRKVENNICELASELLFEYISRGQSAHQMFTFPAMHEWWCHHLPSLSAVWKALKIRRKYRQVAAPAAMHGAWRQAVPDPKWVNTRLLEISLTQQCGIHESERRKERTREVKFHISVFTRKCVVILKEPQVHFLFLSCKTLVTKGQLFQRFLPPSHALRHFPITWPIIPDILQQMATHHILSQAWNGWWW